MKKLLFTTAFIACSLTSVFAQPCLPEGITFTTQSQIDSFQIKYPGCNEIEGDVVINGDDINNLNGLNILTKIEGELFIYSNDALTNLMGLNNLTYIGSHLNIGWWNPLGNGNPALTSLLGLESLTYVGGNLGISNNDALTNLAGLEGVTFVGEGLGISYNDALISFSGLEGLTSMGGSLTIIWCNSLVDLSGLEGLTSIVGDFTIYGNESLINLSGLQNLTSIGGGINIGKVDNFMNIQGNVSLTSLTGLENVQAASIEYLTIMVNPVLSTCSVQSICDYLAEPNGKVTIYGNAIGCNNPGEIALSCGYSIPCLPYGDYYFTLQSDIDNFQTNYPGCTQLEGNVIIKGDNITNLNGLSVLNSVEENLEIGNILGGSQLLEELSGLENLTHTSGNLYISRNKSLKNLSGLEGLTFVGGDFLIHGNDSLINTTGIESLTTIEGSLNIGISIFPISNPNLTTLSGFENLNSIGGGFYISNQDLLADLSPLANLASVGGQLRIKNNSSINTLYGLYNIEPGSITDLGVFSNPMLSECDVQSICDYLVTPNGTVSIYDNAPGCNSQQEVEEACNSCLPEGITFTSQAQIDNFQINYPGCTEIEGDVTIYGYGITNLYGLDVLANIEGNLKIGGTGSGVNPNLLNLSGLENLTTIGGYLKFVNNSSLTNFSGLENLTSIGDLSVLNNTSLTSFLGLENLTSIDNIAMVSNWSLTSLSGLDNVDGASIDNLSIAYNFLLSTCSVQSICLYLSDPNGTIEIYDNAPGCNSQQEVEEACWTSVKEVSYEDSFLISPNPCTASTNLRFTINEQGFTICELFEISGIKVKSLINEIKMPGVYEIEIDLIDLKSGVYFCVLKTNNGIQTKKIIKL